MEISQNDGKIQVYAADMWLKGGLMVMASSGPVAKGQARWTQFNVASSLDRQVS